MDNINKNKKMLYALVKQMIVEDNKKKLAKVDISAVLKSLK